MVAWQAMYDAMKAEAVALSADLEKTQTDLDAATEAAKTALCVLSAVKGDAAYKPHPNMTKDIDIAIAGLRAVTT